MSQYGPETHPVGRDCSIFTSPKGESGMKGLWLRQTQRWRAWGADCVSLQVWDTAPDGVPHTCYLSELLVTLCLSFPSVQGTVVPLSLGA